MVKTGPLLVTWIFFFLLCFGHTWKHPIIYIQVRKENKKMF